MKKVIKKAISSRPEPILIQIDPSLSKNSILVPKVKYEVMATVEPQQVFSGMVIPIPKALLYYLNHNELMVVATILEDTTNNGECNLTVRDLAIKLKISIPTISNVLYTLRKQGLLIESPNGKRGAGRIRKLNFKAIQHLNDLLKDENPGVFTRLRKSTRKIDIANLTKEDIEKSYDNKVLAPDHDPAEEEEYD